MIAHVTVLRLRRFATKVTRLCPRCERTLRCTRQPHLLLCHVNELRYNETQQKLTLASVPPKLPKLRLVLLPCRLEGGRPPPLAGGCGIGDGDVWGDVTRGFDGVLTAKEFVDWLGCGVAFCAAAEASAG